MLSAQSAPKKTSVTHPIIRIPPDGHPGLEPGTKTRQWDERKFPHQVRDDYADDRKIAINPRSSTPSVSSVCS